MLTRIALLTAALAVLIPATADASLECRGTGARIGLGGAPLELYTAGGGGACQADTSTLVAADEPALGLDANVLRADTATPATASARLSGLHLGTPAVRADEVNAQASASCSGGESVLHGSANASGLSVGGIDIDGQDVTQTVQDAASGLPVGAIVHVVSGEEVRSTDTLVERGAHITVTAPGGGLLADVVLAEARVAAVDAPCSAAAAAGSGARAILEPADGHTLVASASPSSGAAVDGCTFTLDGGTLTGSYDPGTRECRADATGAAPGQHAVGVSVHDSAGQTAADSGAVTFSALDPTAQLLPRDGRTLPALAAAPGSTLASCTLGVRSGDQLAYTELPGTPDATGCSAALATADYPPGDYDVRVLATNADGATATDSGRISIPGPAVDITRPGTTAKPGDSIAATITPADGTSLTGCSAKVDAGDVSRPLSATLDGSRCLAAIPADLAPGPSVVTMAATDTAGETGRGSRDVTIAPLYPAAPPGSGGSVPSRALADAYLACGSRSVALVDVSVSGKRVKLLGAARALLSGKAVEIRKVGAKAVVARATVGKDGMFQATAALPRRHGKLDRKARYQAKIGTAASASLKLTRELVFTSVKTAGGKLTVSGRATGRYGKRGVQLVLRRRVSCTREVVAGKAKVGKGGRFKATVKLPAGAPAALYRAVVKVRRASTFTLPRAVAG